MEEIDMKLEDIKKLEPVQIELDNKVKVLQYDMNAFSMLERKYGSVDGAMEQLQKGRMDDIKYILWAGLIHDEVTEFDEDTGEPLKYGVSPWSVGKAIKNAAYMAYASELMGKAMAQGLEQSEETSAGDNTPKNM
jgi:hypothetical protein